MKIFHLQSKESKRNFYYKTLASLHLNWGSKKLGVSKFTLDRFNFDETLGRYENEKVIIQKGKLLGTSEVQMMKLCEAIFEHVGGYSLTSEGVVKIDEYEIEYKKGFVFNTGEKFRSIEEVITFLQK